MSSKSKAGRIAVDRCYLNTATNERTWQLSESDFFVYAWSSDIVNKARAACYHSLVSTSDGKSLLKGLVEYVPTEEEKLFLENSIINQYRTLVQLLGIAI